MKEVRHRLADGVAVADALVAQMRSVVARKVQVGNKIDRALIDAEQHIAHGLAWYATYTELLRSVQEWGDSLASSGLFGEVEACVADVLLDEYLAQMLGGNSLSQSELITPSDFDLR